MVAKSWNDEEGHSSQRLLQEDDDKFPPTESLQRKHHRSTLKWKSWTTLHAVLICLYSATYLALVLLQHKTPSAPDEIVLPLPAREAMKPQVRHFPTLLEGNAFAGAPRPELEAAWHTLLQNDNIRVPRAVLDKLHLHSIYTRDGTEGIVSLSVYHSLHCLKLVRRMMYKEHYHPNLSSTAMERQIKHADHCVEYLRETLMCRPDISLVTFRWINDTAQHPDEPSAYYPTNFDSSQHECTAWEPLSQWAGERVFDLYNVDLLDRPEP